MELSNVFLELKTQCRRLEAEVYPQVIKFRKTADAHGYMSNFYWSRMYIDGKSYLHVEGYYQSQKFSGINEAVAEQIRNTSNAMDTKRISQRNPLTQQQLHEWDNGRKQAVMKRGLMCKFLSNTRLLNELLSTGETVLVEDSLWDSYWGCGRDGNGTNMLGKTLMEVRTILRDTSF